MSIPEQSGDSFDFCVLFRVYFTEKGADALIANQEAAVRQAAADLAQKQKEFSESSNTLATAEKVFGGTYVQSLAAEERQRRETQYLPNGIKSANGEGI